MTATLDAEHTATATALRVVAIVSLLGDDADVDAATRLFRGAPVLAATLCHVVEAIGDVAVLAWEDQVGAARVVVDTLGGSVTVRNCGPRGPNAAAEATAAALRWADGWRGGLLATTTFDKGFDAAAIRAAMDDGGFDAAMLVSPDAALAESDVLRSVVAHLAADADLGHAFTPGTPGSGAIALRRSTLDDLAVRRRGPGWLLAYDPDRPTHDPIAKAAAVAVPPRVARTSARLTVDSGRQVRRLSQLNNECDAAERVATLEAVRELDPLPRDVTIELTARRATRPVWSMLAKHAIERPDLPLHVAEQLFADLAAADDVRVTFAGAGDPLMHPDFAAIVAAARDAGIRALHVETDLLPDDPSTIDVLSRGEVDVVSVHLPAAHAATYAALMGVDRMRDVLENVRRLLTARLARGGGTPIVVPTFVKCAANLGEMEQWYDQWLRAVGAAAIVGPSDYAGRIAYAGVADMTPGTRVPCRRLRSRITVLSDGSVATCEEDVLGEQRCGGAGDIASAWRDGAAMLRTLHDERRWDETPLCGKCRMWDRP